MRSHSSPPLLLTMTLFLAMTLLSGCGQPQPERPAAPLTTRAPLAQIISTSSDQSGTATPPPSPAATQITATVALSATGTPSPIAPSTESAAPTHTTSPSPTLPPTHTATAYPFATPDQTLPTPATPIPTPVAPLGSSAETINIALLGNDVEWAQGGRTDSIIIISINRQNKTANLLSLPRDLYVYIPGWTMNRINLALPHGYGVDYAGGGGQLFKDTILYNFGIPIDYYIRIGFNGFKQIIDILGGVEVVVSCPLQDWRLKSPDLDPQIEENWEQFTLLQGVHHMDGDLALWYARSRLSTNDFERGWRQQKILRAILNKGVELELVSQLPSLWQTYSDHVETDLTLPKMLELASMAQAVRDNGIQHLTFSGTALRGWRVPTTGEAVQLINWEEALPTFEQLLQPPVFSRGTRPPLTVEVITSSDGAYRMAAENLAWYGFSPVRGNSQQRRPYYTRISYFGPNFKGSFDWLLSWVFNQDVSEIELVTDRESQYDYQVVLGTDYNPCRPPLDAPRQGIEEP